MSITLRKEDIFSEKAIEKAGLSDDFKEYAMNVKDKYNHAARKLSTRTEMSVGVGMAGLSMASASLQGLLLPSSPAIVATGIAMGVAGAIGCALTEVAKKNKEKLGEALSTPFNFFKEKMNMKENDDGTIDLSLKSKDLEQKAAKEPVNYFKENPEIIKELENERRIKDLGLSEEFAQFSQKNAEAYTKARNSSGSNLQTGVGFAGMAGLAAFSTQVQMQLANATTVAEHSITNIMSSADPFMITSALVGVAGAVGFSVAEYAKQKNLSGLKKDINNSEKFLEELGTLGEERIMMSRVLGHEIDLNRARKIKENFSPSQKENFEKLMEKGASDEELEAMRNKNKEMEQKMYSTRQSASLSLNDDAVYDQAINKLKEEVGIPKESNDSIKKANKNKIK